MPKIPAKNWTALGVRREKTPGKHALGDRLYLEVKPDKRGGLSRRFYWRGTVTADRKEISIGSVSQMSLSEAREIAQQWSRIARKGGNPKQDRDKGKSTVLSFKDVAWRCYEAAIKPGLSNSKHKQQWIKTLETYAFPRIGNRPINAITQEDVIGLISPIWLEKHETASRTLQRIRRVFEWARPRADCGLGNQMNPAVIPKDALPIVPKTEQKHHAALPYKELPKLMRKLEEVDAMSAFALRFLILCASRPIEVRGAKWTEVNLGKRLWTIPGTRMKQRKEHIVPLSPPAVEILKAMQGLSEMLVFPSVRDPHKMMSDSTMNSLLVRLGVPREKTTAHGFRSTFRDWAEEKTGFSHEVKEMALAHTIKNRTEAAYRRTALLDKRKKLMAEWAEFATGYDTKRQRK